MTDRITFRVRVGLKPEPEGSMRIVPDYSRPRIEGRPNFGRLINNNQTELDRWRAAVAEAAQRHFPVPLLGPVRAHFLFLLLAPKRLTRAKRLTELPAVKPDCSKLVRGAEDAMSGIAYPDDARITSELVQKRWAVEDGDVGVIITLGPDSLAPLVKP